MAYLKTAGLRDWVIQRVSAVVIGVYAIWMLIYLVLNQPLGYAKWHHLQQHLTIKLFTLLVLLSVLAHAWIGLWTVFTDYIKNFPLRMVLQVVVFLLLLGYVFWGIEILWG